MACAFPSSAVMECDPLILMEAVNTDPLSCLEPLRVIPNYTSSVNRRWGFFFPLSFSFFPQTLIYEWVIYNTSDKAATQLEIFYNGCNTTSIIMKNVCEIIFCQRTSSQILLRTCYLHEHHIFLKYGELGRSVALGGTEIPISCNQLGCGWWGYTEEKIRWVAGMVRKCVLLLKKTSFIRILPSLTVGWIQILLCFLFLSHSPRSYQPPAVPCF